MTPIRPAAAALALFLALTAWLALPPGPARAQTGAACDCSQNLGQCRGSAGWDGSAIVVAGPQCGLVTYSINGNPETTTITGGAERVDWFGSGTPDVSYGDCMQCAVANSAALGGGAGGGSGGASVCDAGFASVSSQLNQINVELQGLLTQMMNGTLGMGDPALCQVSRQIADVSDRLIDLERQCPGEPMGAQMRSQLTAASSALLSDAC